MEKKIFKFDVYPFIETTTSLQSEVNFSYLLMCKNILLGFLR